MALDKIIEAIVTFRDEREWEQFHTLRNLAAAISVEAGELQELFLWDDSTSSEAPANADRISDEIADVLIFALLFCQKAGIDPERAIEEKLETNRQRCPVNKARGRSAKYTELEDSE